ncbi:hypothetical protein FB451DRAFT_1450980 [Mycena latifolia]|nr:hypothetical protein FB451DRAFT_1450980 [Mycena latifolia]
MNFEVWTNGMQNMCAGNPSAAVSFVECQPPAGFTVVDRIGVIWGTRSYSVTGPSVWPQNPDGFDKTKIHDLTKLTDREEDRNKVGKSKTKVLAKIGLKDGEKKKRVDADLEGDRTTRADAIPRPVSAILHCYALVLDFYQQAGATRAMDEEHITLQISLELARDFKFWTDPDGEQDLVLWTKLSGADDLGERDTWKKQIIKLQKEQHLVHIAPSNKSFEKFAGFDMVWFLNKKYTIYLQGMTFWPSVLQCTQLVAFEQTAKELAQEGSFFGYIIYGPKPEQLWLIPVLHITHALDKLYADPKCPHTVGPDANNPFTDKTLASFFCGPASNYSFSAILGAAMGVPQAMPDLPEAKDITPHMPKVPNNSNIPYTSLEKMRKQRLADMEKAKQNAADKKGGLRKGT